MKRWRMESSCADCPFNKDGAGLALRKALRPGRFADIKASLNRGETFQCHKTTSETGNGSNLLCAGSLDYQHGRGIIGQYERICLRLDAMAESCSHASRQLKNSAPSIGLAPEEAGG